MSKEARVGEDEKIGQYHLDELPEHERRATEATDAATAEDAAEEWFEEPRVRWHEDEPAIDPDAEDLPIRGGTH